MKSKDRDAVKTISEAFQALPDDKKEYLIGFAEGVVAAKKAGRKGGQAHIVERRQDK